MNGRRYKNRQQRIASLPSCRVCGELGCGLHYGVITCDACKGFFRRSLIRQEPYVCIQSQFCHVTSNIRIRNCPKCRYDHCVAIGMSRKACKVGRYSTLTKSTMKDSMEHKTSSGDDELVLLNTVTKTFHTEALEQKSPPMTKPIDFPIPNISVALSKDEEIRWNVGGPHGNIPNDNVNSTSSYHDSNANFNIYKDKPISDTYDQSLSSSSRMNYGSSSREMDVQECTSNCNGKSEMSYTVIRKPPHRGHLDTTATSTVLSLGYRPYLDPDNLTPWSQPSTAQHDFSITDRQSLVDLPMDPPRTPMLQSIGHPITDAHNCVKRSFNQVPNVDDQHLKMTTTYESNNSHFLSVTSSNTYKKRIKSENEKEDNANKSCFLQTSDKKTVMEPIISNQKSVFEYGQKTSSNPTFLFYVNPNLYNFLLSVFDRFPFISYEKNSLASIFKKCYKISENLIGYSIISQSTSDTNKLNSPDSNRALTKTLSKEMHSNTICSLKYNENVMDDIFSYLMTTHNRYIKDESSFLSDSEIRSAQNTYWDLCQFQDTVHGKMTFIDDDKYYTILETTGIDFDKRREYLLTYIGPSEECIRKTIEFFNSLPGFDDFTVADKITLIKSCSNEYYLLSRHRGIDTNKSISIDEENGTAYRFCLLGQLFPMLAASQQEWDDTTNDLKALTLSLEEIIVLKALVVTNPDADGILEQPDIVRECHQTYHKCLLNLVRKRHGSQADDRFANIVRVLYTSINKIRNVKKYYLEQIPEKIFRMIGQDASTLFKEVFEFSSDQNEIEKLM